MIFNQDNSDLIESIARIGTRASLTAPTITDAWLASSYDGEYQITGGNKSGTIIADADVEYGVLTVARSFNYGYIFYHSTTGNLYFRDFNQVGSTIYWRTELKRVASAKELESKVLTPTNNSTHFTVVQSNVRYVNGMACGSIILQCTSNYDGGGTDHLLMPWTLTAYNFQPCMFTAAQWDRNTTAVGRVYCNTNGTINLPSATSGQYLTITLAIYATPTT